MSVIRSELKDAAKKALSGNWGVSIGVFVIYQLIATGASLVPIVGAIAVAICGPALALGYILFFLNVSRGKELSVGTLFEGFPAFWKAFGLCFMVGLFTLLWSLLLIIPGIIAAISYSMTLYILADNPEIDIMDAIRQSKRMTNGYKGDIFVLGLSFLGWGIVACLTLGIGFLWLAPYMQTTYTNLYLKLKENITE